MRISVDGNIGAGKSSVLAAARKAGVADVFPEPVEEWGDLLRNFYERPAEYALPFSLTVLLSYDVPYARPTCVVERSPLACRHVFTQLLHNDGVMSQPAWELFKAYSDVLGWTPDLIVYVDTPANVCLDRVRGRGREGEDAVDLTYLRRIEYKYDIMLKYCNVPVVRLDGSLPPDELAAAGVRAIRQALTAPPASSSPGRASTSCTPSSTAA